VVDRLALPEAKTRHMVTCLKGLGVSGSALIVTAGVDAALERAARNLRGVKVLRATGLNVYDVLDHGQLIMTRDALAEVATRLGGAA
jgi:large subunit ribosomal protein L4